jgi:hypothetical protein
MALEQATPTTLQHPSLARRGATYFEMSGPGEFIAAAVLFALMIVIRVVNILHYRFDSDEPQHLHVIWAWARGFVQYRDLFDNHMPLFHMMFAPIFGFIGDRATILYVMRFVLLPMYFVAAWCTYKIGMCLFSRRAGIWAVILAGLYTRYHFVSLEFRTDNLWAPLWLLCITVLVTGPLTARRALVAGLLLGLCFGVNLLAPGASRNSLAYRIPLALTIISALLVTVYVARRMIRGTAITGLAVRRWFVLMVCVSYFLAFKTFWPVRSHDDDPPPYPLVAVLCSSALLAASTKLISFKWNPGQILRRGPLPAFLAVGEIFVLIAMQPIWKDRTKQETDLLRNVLTLLKPGDYVLDCKGETVFRQRCVWPVFETITMSGIERGIIVDNTPQRCIETHTCAVATPLIKRLPYDTRRFVKRNYLPVTAELRIAGEELKPSATNPRRCEFEVTIPAPYEIISPNENVSGTLDGVLNQGARFLAAGQHIFESASTSRHLILLWAQAVDRHFSPFEHHTSPND